MYRRKHNVNVKMKYLCPYSSLVVSQQKWRDNKKKVKLPSFGLITVVALCINLDISQFNFNELSEYRGFKAEKNCALWMFIFYFNGKYNP